jgi:hypothetical protein
MTIELLQDAFVTLAAAGAAFVLVRNIVTMFRPARNGPACNACGPTCASTQPKTPAVTIVPLKLVRRQKS